MDSQEWYKPAGAVLAALLLIFGVKTYIERESHVVEKPGYVLPMSSNAEGAKEGKPAEEKATAAAEGSAAGGDVMAALAKANVENGKAIFSKCKSCHVAEKGKTPTVGPNLWGVVNRPKGSYPGFQYTEQMKAKGGDWSFAELGHFLANPKGFIPGTKMVFPGLSSASEQADVIAYLATLADTPVPLPK